MEMKSLFDNFALSRDKHSAYFQFDVVRFWAHDESGVWSPTEDFTNPFC